MSFLLFTPFTLATRGLAAPPAPCSAGSVALTLDDGPDPLYTPQMLAILAEADVKATFFLMGQKAEAQPDLVERMSREGHLIANHTWSHARLTELSHAERVLEIETTNLLLAQLGVRRPTFIRPPYGSVDMEVLATTQLLDMEVAMWTVALDVNDWKGFSAEILISTVMTGLQDGGVILMHDGITGSKNTLVALPVILEKVKERGYCFLRLDQRSDWLMDHYPGR